MTTKQQDYANWDLTAYFPSFDGPEYREFRDAYRSDIKKLTAQAEQIGAIGGSTIDAWADLIVQLESLDARAGHLFSYLGCLTSEDTTNEPAKSEDAAMAATYAEHRKLYVTVNAAFRAAGDAEFDALVGHESLKGAEYSLRRARERAQKMMDAELEKLAADLGVDGIEAWGRIYDQIAGTLKFELKKPDGSTETVPMAMARSTMQNPDPAIRKAAFEGANASWATMEDVCASAMNAIAGTRHTLYRRRGIGHFLDEATFGAAITRKTLDAMFSAIAQRYELPRRYLRAKAKLMGKEKLGFYDLSAPLPVEAHEVITWTRAKEKVLGAFGSAYPALGEFTKMAFDKNWIETEARANKRPGGYCTGSEHIAETRIYMTYNDTTDDVQTLAHELGHAFHSWVMRDMRPIAREYPMTLAETASTFAENIYTDALLADPAASDEQKAIVLDTRLEGAAAFLLNIPMRFIFEKAFYEERAHGEVTVSRLKKLMLDAQDETYGDVLDAAAKDPYFWCSKLHFYISGLSFYNFPYSFGYLFSMGVYARAKKEGAAFLPKYEELLRLTGSDTAENVARRSIGVDLESPEFWLESIDMIESDLKQFEELAPKVVKKG